MNDPTTIRTEWMRLRASERGLHALDCADRVGVTECELLASVCGEVGEVSATRLEARFPDLLRRLPELRHVKTVTRNRQAVIEVEGTFDNVEFFGAMGQSVSSIDLRIFSSRWHHAFAVREETRRGTSRGLQFFDASGTAIHKLYLRPESDHDVYEALVREHTSANQGKEQSVSPPEPSETPRPDSAIDVTTLREAWLAMRDTHDFFGLLRKHRVERTQALRLVGEDLARPVAARALADLLERVAGTDLPIMVFVGNPGVIQIHTGAIRRVVRMGSWLNVLDPGFDLHVRDDAVASSWVVRKPTVDGLVTALELYDAAGAQIALVVGKRKPGKPEDAAWRAHVESLA